MSAGGSFRISARNFFLTYPHCNARPEEFFNAIGESGKIPTSAAAVQELHKDGEPHLHAVLLFGRKQDVRRHDFFDFEYCGRSYHCNIKVCYDPGGSIRYMSKYDTPVFFGDSLGVFGRGFDRLIMCESQREAEEACKGISSRDQVIFAERISSWIQSRFPGLLGFDPIVLGESWRHAEWEKKISSWYVKSLIEERPKSLILVGPTRCGKTTFARSLGRHMYFNGAFDLSKWDSSVSYAIFDDFEWQFMPFKKCFFGCQKCFVLTDKYKGKRTVEWGKPMIFICNELPNELCSSWYKENTELVQV